MAGFPDFFGFKCANIGDITRGNSEYIISCSNYFTIVTVFSLVVVTSLLYTFFVTLGVSCREFSLFFPFTIKSMMDCCFGFVVNFAPVCLRLFLGVLGGPCVGAVITIPFCCVLFLGTVLLIFLGVLGGLYCRIKLCLGLSIHPC